MTIYRIRFLDRTLKRIDCRSFVAAVRAIRREYPGVDFGEWVELPQPFGSEMLFYRDGEWLGMLREVTLKGIPA